MRFKLDENLPVAMVALFREAGHDAMTVVDQGFGGATDRKLMAVCAREDRVIVTMDTGFSDVRAYPPRAYPGIVLFRLGRQSRKHILRAATRLVRILSNASPEGQLWIVEEARIRVRE